ncbi:thymidine phosphorylase [Synergistaceae bacterium OttesenSCG-928-I11]|nr:thymidine phosphorylase [Synergistaceae bacterium OttesenSCG-928-I11]
MFRAIDFIERKRDDGEHAERDLRAFVTAVRDEDIPDYQTAAWLMAVYFNGLCERELRAFTEALATSGDVVSLPPGKTAVDKHSTGGVGDKTTLIVAPLVASCGLNVAKLSGRGLGFTGGTVDKLESIPGMNVHLATEDFARQVDEIGIAISGHSMALAPAEGKFYALRDVTGTVPSLPLIASSIVSKKIAGGADAFVFDVKCGTGAFMQTPDDAHALARALVDLSASLGRRSSCVISDMSQPLGEWVGNAVEVLEAIQVLSGKGPADTRELSLALAAEMLLIGGVAEDYEAAHGLAKRKLDSGEALEKFASVVRMQGGDPTVCYEPERVLQAASRKKTITAPTRGYVGSLDARAVGNAIKALGGGRTRKDDVVDLAVGVRIFKKIGDSVSEGEAVAEIYYNNDSQLAAAELYFQEAYTFADTAEPRRLILDRVC